MDVSLVHNKDQQGIALIQYFQDNWEQVEVKESVVNNQDYYLIYASNGEKLNEPYRLNPIEAIKNLYDEKKLTEMLELNRIPIYTPVETVVKTYDVFLLDGEVISIRQSTGGKGERDVRYVRNPFSSQVTKLARESAYFLNLDYVMVTIVQTNKKRYSFHHIHPSPILRNRDFKKVLEYFNNLKKNVPIPKPGGVKLGADPEFMIANSRNGKMIPASLFYSKDGNIGCDSIRTSNRQHYPVAEVRPDPSASPLAVAQNIRKIMVKANSIAPYNNIKWIAGSLPFPGFTTGGHVHFSNVVFNHHLLRALDNYVGLPLFMIEDLATALKRREKYGFLADYRKKSYGGFEYRTTASWLVSPEITVAVLCLAKVVASHYHLLRSDFLGTTHAIDAFYRGDKEYFRSDIIGRMYKELTMLPLYQEWEKEIGLIFTMIKDRKSWDEAKDLRESWNLETEFSAVYKGQNRMAKNSYRDSTHRTPSNPSAGYRRNPQLGFYGGQRGSFHYNSASSWSTSAPGGYNGYWY